jgi:hypothetical protein
VPWWGPASFHRPWWGGWHGPRVVNNVVISNTSVVSVQNITVYRNADVRNGVVVVNENHFGHGPITSSRVTRVDARSLQPIHAAPPHSATSASFVPTTGRGIRPPDETLRRPVVATRPPHHWEGSASGGERRAGPAGVPSASPHLVSRPPQQEGAPVLPRAPFGQSTVERPTSDRVQPSSPPRPEGQRRSGQGPTGPAPTPRQAPQAARPTPAAPQVSTSPKTEETKRPAPVLTTPPAVTGQAPPEQNKPPQVARPTPVVPQAPTSQKPEEAKRSGPGPTAPPAGTHQGPAEQRQAPQVARPTPEVPQLPGHRAEAQRQSSRPLPGEPANHLSPNRAEAGKTSREGQRAPGPPVSPQGGPERQQGGRGGG